LDVKKNIAEKIINCYKMVRKNVVEKYKLLNLLQNAELNNIKLELEKSKIIVDK
jgi:hypothetical protein